MTEKETNKLKEIKNKSAESSEVPTNQQQQGVEKQLITLQGYTTSQIRTRTSKSDTPAYCFFKTDEQEQDIPVIFRIKEREKDCQFHQHCSEDCRYKKGSWIKPKISKYSYLQVAGNYSNSNKERPSFTAYSYQLLAAFSPEAKTISKPIERRYF